MPQLSSPAALLAVGCTWRAWTCYPWGMTDGAIETVMERTGQEEIRLVRFLYADHGGIIRGQGCGHHTAA